MISQIIHVFILLPEERSFQQNHGSSVRGFVDNRRAVLFAPLYLVCPDGDNKNTSSIQLRPKSSGFGSLLLHGCLLRPSWAKSIFIQKHTGSQSQWGLVRDFCALCKVSWTQVVTRSAEWIQMSHLRKNSGEWNLSQPVTDPRLRWIPWVRVPNTALPSDFRLRVPSGQCLVVQLYKASGDPAT